MTNATFPSNWSLYFNSHVNDVHDSEIKSKLFFNIMVRGVLNCSINLLATFMNVSTIVAICKYKNLKTTSNALIVGFSLGNSLSGINGILTLVTAFGVNKLSNTWTLICSILGFFLLWQQFINIFSLMAISLERAYSVYFPLHSLKTNSFNKMIKVSIFIIVFTLLKSATEAWLGFEFGNNFRRRNLCLLYCHPRHDTSDYRQSTLRSPRRINPNENPAHQRGI